MGEEKTLIPGGKRKRRKHTGWKITVGMDEYFYGKVSPSLFRRAAVAALETALPETQDKLELSLFVTGEPGIAALNNKYRKTDKPTDVLSFSFTENHGPETQFISPGAVPFLGEVVLCYPYILTQAELDGQSRSKALAWATIHGVLHLLGRKHYKKTDRQAMQEEEQKALRLFAIQDRKEV